MFLRIGFAILSDYMDIVKDFKDGLDRIIHPNKNRDKMSIEKALRFYYRVMVLPLIVSLVLGFIFGSFYGPMSLFSLFGPVSGHGGILSGILSVVYVLLIFLVLIPVEIIINAAILQLFSKLIFKIWKGDISKTVTAVMFSELPVVLFYWLLFIPIVKYVVIIPIIIATILALLITIILELWSIYVLVVSLAVQHNISKLRAFAGWLLPIVILFVVVEVLIILVFALGSL